MAPLGSVYSLVAGGGGGESADLFINDIILQTSFDNITRRHTCDLRSRRHYIYSLIFFVHRLIFFAFPSIFALCE